MKKVVMLILILFLGVCSNMYILKYFNIGEENQNITVSYYINSSKKNSFQIFYSNSSNYGWSEQNSQTIEYKTANKLTHLEFLIPKYSKYIRIDFGNLSGKLELQELKIKFKKYEKKIKLDGSNIITKNDISKLQEKKNDIIEINAIGNDPYIILSSKNLNIEKLINMKTKDTGVYLIIKIMLCIILDVVLILVNLKSKNILLLINELKNNRRLILNLSKNDFKTKYAGSYLGIIWAFIQPIITILVYWFVFEYGLRAGSPIEKVPFILWLMTGLTPWFFYSDGLINATNCMQEYSYLVKKVVFKISILPIVKIISALFVHLVFIIFLFIVAFCYKFYPTFYTLQIFYYLFCLFFMILSISYATSAIILFFKDLGQIINIFLQIGIWMTPIMWNYKILSPKYQWLIKLNPMFYIVDGYRDTFIGRVWFWEKQLQTIYFWGISLAIFYISTTIFKKLKQHFADVL